MKVPPPTHEQLQEIKDELQQIRILLEKIVEKDKPFKPPDCEYL